MKFNRATSIVLAGRIGCLLVGAVTVTSPVTADDAVALKGKSEPGRLTRVTAKLEVDGRLSVEQDGKPETLKLNVAGQLRYDERVLDETTARRRSVRHYDQADAVIRIDRSSVKPTLRDDCRLIAVEEKESAMTLHSPRVPLTREELDLIDYPGSSLLLPTLLPMESVRVGTEWSHENSIWVGLLRLDAIGSNDVKSRLAELKQGTQAVVTLRGHVDGAVDGVTTEIELTGRYTFDIKHQTFVDFVLEIHEKRAASPIGPGLDVTAKLQLVVAPLASCEELTEAVLQKLPLTLRAAGDRLSYLPAESRFRLLHSRSWHVMDERPEMAILRMVDRGELVAQCNIAVPTVPKSDEPPTLQKFQADVEQALGKNFGQFVQVSTRTNDLGNLVHRVVATGQVAELPIEWHYYLVANRAGKHVILAFTMEQSLVERLADSDQEMADSLELISVPAAKTAATTKTTK